MTDSIENGIKAAGAAIAGIATFIWGKPDYWFAGLLAFMVIDYLSGISAAIVTKELSSQKGLQGIVKKILFLAPVAVAHIVDSAIGAGGTVRSLAIGFLLANEGISILENCARCGVPFPDKLLAILKQLSQDGGE